MRDDDDEMQQPQAALTASSLEQLRAPPSSSRATVAPALPPPPVAPPPPPPPPPPPTLGGTPGSILGGSILAVPSEDEALRDAIVQRVLHNLLGVEGREAQMSMLDLVCWTRSMVSPEKIGRFWGEGAARCFKINFEGVGKDESHLVPMDEVVCPISTTTLEDPVVTVDGSVYERRYIEQWFRQRRAAGSSLTSPATGLELSCPILMPLTILRGIIEAYLEHRPETGAVQHLESLLTEANEHAKATHAELETVLQQLETERAKVVHLEDMKAKVAELEAELLETKELLADANQELEDDARFDQDYDVEELENDGSFVQDRDVEASSDDQSEKLLWAPETPRCASERVREATSPNKLCVPSSAAPRTSWADEFDIEKVVWADEFDMWILQEGAPDSQPAQIDTCLPISDDPPNVVQCPKRGKKNKIRLPEQSPDVPVLPHAQSQCTTNTQVPVETVTSAASSLPAILRVPPPPPPPPPPPQDTKENMDKKAQKGNKEKREKRSSATCAAHAGSEFLFKQMQTLSLNFAYDEHAKLGIKLNPPDPPGEHCNDNGRCTEWSIHEIHAGGLVNKTRLARPGDAILAVNGENVNLWSDDEMGIALKARPLELLLWRELSGPNPGLQSWPPEVAMSSSSVRPISERGELQPRPIRNRVGQYLRLAFGEMDREPLGVVMDLAMTVVKVGPGLADGSVLEGDVLISIDDQNAEGRDLDEIRRYLRRRPLELLFWRS